MCQLVLNVRLLGLTFFLSIWMVSALSQDIQYYNPLANNAIQGRLANKEVISGYGRLPEVLESRVRDAVWTLGQNAAGLYIDFKTNADRIHVRYKVKGRLNMPHMPTIGVSGVDLYVQNTVSKEWMWAYGDYSFKDTVTYKFDNLERKPNDKCRLYLPLYNTIEWLEIGVDKAYSLTFMEGQVREKPIVIYGTSIAQGACASRPGMAWTNIVGRSLPNEIINLGFSGNGRLEQPVLDFIISNDAAIFVLDCIPNLTVTKDRSAQQLDSILMHAVRFIRSQYPNVPIVMTDHSSAFTQGFLNKNVTKEYNDSSIAGYAAFNYMKSKGANELYWLGHKELGLDVNSTVDYAHPNDYGMMKIAQGYIKMLEDILRKKK